MEHQNTPEDKSMTKSSNGQNFLNDPEVTGAIEILAKKLDQYKKTITKVKPADTDLSDNYQNLLTEFGENRGGKLFFPYLGSGLGSGPFVELNDGSVKYDFITGIGVHFFGHSNTDIMKAMVKGSLSNTAMQGHLQQNVESAHYAKTILKHANKYGAKLAHCFLTTTGVMTNENALKLAFNKNQPTTRILAFEKCFAGRTMAMAYVTDKAAYRTGLPKTLDVDYVPFYDEADHEGSIMRAVEVLKAHLYRYPKSHAAFLMELIQGEAGSFVGHEDFFKALITECKKHHISIIADEVQTFGRTSELFAFQYFKLDEFVDIVCVGKNSQVCSTLFNKEHAPSPGLISQTFTTSSSTVAAGQYILDQLAGDEYIGENGKNMKFHKHFKKHLEALNKKYPTKIEGPYGIGAMVAMTIFGGSAEKTKEFTLKLFDNGVMGFMAGGNPTRLRFLIPSGAIETHHIDEVAAIIEQTLNEVN